MCFEYPVIGHRNCCRSTGHTHNSLQEAYSTTVPADFEFSNCMQSAALQIGRNVIRRNVEIM
eukprot:scaffold236171_cov19-Prasinocladus_malaysianus.AAC.1